MSMKTIYKYRIGTKDRNVLKMPVNAKILCVQVQNGEPHLWAIVDPSKHSVERTIAVYGTGHPMTGNGEYIGTYQLYGGAIVFHAFDETVTNQRL